MDQLYHLKCCLIWKSFLMLLHGFNNYCHNDMNRDFWQMIHILYLYYFYFYCENKPSSRNSIALCHSIEGNYFVLRPVFLYTRCVKHAFPIPTFPAFLVKNQSAFQRNRGGWWVNRYQMRGWGGLTDLRTI